MLLGIEIHGMHLAFRSAHVNTLANNDDEKKPYLFAFYGRFYGELTLCCVVRLGLLPNLQCRYPFRPQVCLLINQRFLPSWALPRPPADGH